LQYWNIDSDISRIIALLNVSHGGVISTVTRSSIVHVLSSGLVGRVHGLRRRRWWWRMKKIGRLMVRMYEMMVDHGNRHGYRHLLLVRLQRWRWRWS